MTYEELQEELRQADATIDVLKGALAADVIDAIDVPHWAMAITPQQRHTMGILIAKFPRFVRREHICENIPHYDLIKEYDVRIVDVIVCAIRRRLGQVIERKNGYGYRAAPDFMARLRAQS